MYSVKYLNKVSTISSYDLHKAIRIANRDTHYQEHDIRGIWLKIKDFFYRRNSLETLQKMVGVYMTTKSLGSPDRSNMQDYKVAYAKFFDLCNHLKNNIMPMYQDRLVIKYSRNAKHPQHGWYGKLSVSVDHIEIARLWGRPHKFDPDIFANSTVLDNCSEFITNNPELRIMKNDTGRIFMSGLAPHNECRVFIANLNEAIPNPVSLENTILATDQEFCNAWCRCTDRIFPSINSQSEDVRDEMVRETILLNAEWYSGNRELYLTKEQEKTNIAWNHHSTGDECYGDVALLNAYPQSFAAGSVQDLIEYIIDNAKDCKEEINNCQPGDAYHDLYVLQHNLYSVYGNMNDYHRNST